MPASRRGRRRDEGRPARLLREGAAAAVQPAGHGKDRCPAARTHTAVVSSSLVSCDPHPYPHPPPPLAERPPSPLPSSLAHPAHQHPSSPRRCAPQCPEGTSCCPLTSPDNGTCAVGGTCGCRTSEDCPPGMACPPAGGSTQLRAPRRKRRRRQLPGCGRGKLGRTQQQGTRAHAGAQGSARSGRRSPLAAASCTRDPAAALAPSCAQAALFACG